MKLITLALIFFTATSYAMANDNFWLTKLTSISPLESTEKEVEQILGAAKKRYANIGEYKIKEGEISVIYSEGKCTRNSATEFDVKKGTVISFDFRPETVIKFSSLKLNLKKLEKEEVFDVEDSLIYYDFENGISYNAVNSILK